MTGSRLQRLPHVAALRLRSIWTMLTGFRRPLRTIAIFTRGTRGRTAIVGLRQSPLSFEVRGAMDAWCLKETLLDRVYERFGTPIGRDWTVIDIGAGIGDFTVLAAREAPAGRVYAFEPFPESFALLQRNVARNGVGNVHVREMAVTGRERRLALDTTRGEPLMIESVDASNAGGQHVPVASISLERFVREERIGRIDLMKLDCEGGEYDILFSTSAEVLGRVGRIVMEYHDHTTQWTHADLVTFLGGAGYRVEWFPNPVHPDLIGYLRAIRDAESG